MPGPDCKVGGRKSSSWRTWLKHLCEPWCGPRVVHENDGFSEHPAPFFWSTSEACSEFHNKPLTLLWTLVPWILSTKFPYGPRICTSQLAGATIIVSMFHPTLRSENIWGSCSAITNVTCYYWACVLELWQRVSFYQPIGCWFWNCLRILQLVTGNVLISEVDALTYFVLSNAEKHVSYGELVRTTECKTLYPRCRTNRARYNRVQLHIRFHGCAIICFSCV